MKNFPLLLLCLLLFNMRAIAQNPEQRAIQTVRTFVKWYGTNWEKMEDFESKTINADRPFELKEGEENPPYSINFKEAEKYIKSLSETGFFSEKYLGTLRGWFKEADRNFKANPQNEGPPQGFQSDRFFLTQDNFLEDIKNIDKIKITATLLKNNKADVRMYFPYCNMTYHYRLSSDKNGKWKIDSIKVN
ncbi:hypothetical protein HNP38_002502 [Chryseobacterium defluvii]|uniref:DUF3828 domain-containing protein n=1 Tax=Chryseobacterium defluvii TaxID=160396 RepID=A0A840KGS3_9FLAO|nr:hypothetical protein [Chryseobacterium defluvii]MBB4807198.1 hypothetical protein [Chryseobacterium defluvii]